jgi:hypothetical protein
MGLLRDLAITDSENVVLAAREARRRPLACPPRSSGTAEFSTDVSGALLDFSAARYSIFDYARISDCAHQRR